MGPAGAASGPKDGVGINLAHGSSMLVHFNAESAECDNCGNPRTIMHMSVRDLDCSVNLCIACFGALRKTLNQASRKLDGGAPLVMRRAEKRFTLFSRDRQ
jgi:hypothetical protein